MGLKNLREALGAFRYDRDAEEKAKWVERWANVFAAFAEPDEPEPEFKPLEWIRCDRTHTLYRHTEGSQRCPDCHVATDEEKFQRGAKVRLTAKDGSSEVVARLSNNSLGDGSRHFIRIFGQDNHGTSSDEYDIELLDPAK